MWALAGDAQCVASRRFASEGQSTTTPNARTFLVSTTGPVDEHFKWNSLASVTFASSGGTLQPGLHGSGVQFVMDNFDTTPAVPEASNAALLAAGIGLLAVAARRRRAR